MKILVSASRHFKIFPRHGDLEVKKEGQLTCRALLNPWFPMLPPPLATSAIQKDEKSLGASPTPRAIQCTCVAVGEGPNADQEARIGEDTKFIQPNSTAPEAGRVGAANVPDSCDELQPSSKVCASTLIQLHNCLQGGAGFLQVFLE